jgi:hypothetical protein
MTDGAAGAVLRYNHFRLRPSYPELSTMNTLRALTSRRSRRGQSMVEYSMLNWVLAVGLLMASTVKIIPGPQEKFVGGKVNIVDAFLYAAQSYLESVAYVLNQPFP